MPNFSIAFVAPSKNTQLCHRIIEADNKEAALRRFFEEELKEYYSEDDQGYFYFKEDFTDERTRIGNMIEL
jgi:guanylate kinase